MSLTIRFKYIFTGILLLGIATGCAGIAGETGSWLGHDSAKPAWQQGIGLLLTAIFSVASLVFTVAGGYTFINDGFLEEPSGNVVHWS